MVTFWCCDSLNHFHRAICRQRGTFHNSGKTWTASSLSWTLLHASASETGQENYSSVWECVVRSCRSLLTTTLDSKAVVRCNPHNHPDNEALCSAKKLRAALKDSIIHNPNQQTTTLCRTELLQVDSAVAEHLVTKENIARNLMYHRSKQRPALPRTTADLRIPEYLGKTTSGERFILKCGVTEDDTIVIYASDFSVTHLYVTRKQLVATVRLNACQICSLNCSP